MRKLPGKVRLRTWISLGLILVVLPIIAFALFSPSGTEAKWHEPAWQYRKKLTVDPAQVSGSGAHINFPVLVSLSSDADLSAGAQADGDDIIFVDSNSNRLDHEIESYATGTLVAWVRIPELSTSEYTDIYMYYGNTGVASQENIAAVWADYVAVHHLEETTTGATDFIDSSPAGNDSTAVTIDGTGSNAAATGKIGGAVQFDGTNDFINLGTDASLDVATGSICAWVNMDDTPTADEGFFSKDQSGVNQGDAHLRYYNDLSKFSGLLTSSTPTEYFPTSSATASTTTWYYFCMDFGDGQNGYIFQDGVKQASEASTTEGMTNATPDLIIGALRSGTWHFDGIVDEATLSTKRRGADWHLTAYNNQNSPSTFYTTAAEEQNSDSGPVAHWRFDEGVDNSCPGGEDACDSASDTYHANQTGTPTWRNSDYCISGSCLYFDATNDILEVPDTPAFDLNNLSVSLWVKFNETATTKGEDITLMRKEHSVSPFQSFILYQSSSDDTINFEWYNTTPTTYHITSNSALEANKWYHIEATTSVGSPMQLYINGISDSTSNPTPTGSIYLSDGVLDIGAGDSTSKDLKGFLDEIKIYPYQRSADQVKQDFVARGSDSGVVAQFGPDNSFLSDGLVGYWPMDDNVSGNSQTISDLSGNGLDGTTSDVDATGMNCTIAGKFGYGCDFHSGDDSISVAYNSAFDTGAEITLSAWYYADATTTDDDIFAYRTSGLATRYVMVTGSGNDIQFNITIDDTLYSVDQLDFINTGQWYHFVGTYDGEYVRLYVDGELVDETAATGTINNNNQPLYLGSASSDPSDDKVDELRLYNKALSPAEVKKLYNWAPGPVGYWNFDEKTGTSAYDKSGNSNNGTLTNMSEQSWQTGKFGSALNFDGSNDYIAVADNALLRPSNDITISFWAKLDQLASDKGESMMFLRKTDDTTPFHAYFVEISSGDDKYCFNWYNTGGTGYSQCNNTALAANQWYHISVVKNGSNIKTYTNGVDDTAGTGGSPTGTVFSTTPNSLHIGASTSGANRVDGLMDEVKIYNYARNSSQIVQDMNGGHPIGGSPVGSQVSYWKFDEGAANTCEGGTNDTCDSVGNNDGAFSATPPQIASGSSCKIGNCLYFPGTSDRASIIPDSNDFDFGTNSFSVSAWIKKGAISTEDFILMNYVADATDGGFGLNMEADGTLTFGVDDDGSSFPEDQANSTLSYDDNEWHHVVGVKNGNTNIQLYVDGVLVGEDNSFIATGSISNDDDLYIGVRPNGTQEWEDGYIDEVKIYNTALTQEEVLIDMNANSAANFGTGTDESAQVAGTSTSTPLLYYSLNERDETTTVKDISGNGYDGTMNGSIPSSAWKRAVYGYGLTFDGSNDYLQNNSLDISNSSFTVSSWVKRLSNGTNDTIFGIGVTSGCATNTCFQFRYQSANNIKCGFFNNDLTTASGYSSLVNEWHHLACTYDSSGNVRRIYLDGQIVAEDAPGSAMTGSGRMIIGDDVSLTGDNSDLHAELDEVKIWNTALSPSQIAYEYNRGKPIAYWKFDECQGSTLYNSVNDSYNGTLTIGAGGTNTEAGICNGTAGTGWADGTIGKHDASVEFDGTDDYATVPGINLPTGDFSYTGWFKHDNNGPEALFTAGTAGQEIALWVDSNDRLRVYLDLNADAVTTTTTINYDQWYHFALTREGSNVTLYLNGLVEGTHTDADALTFSGCDFYIGIDYDSGCATTPGNYWDGDLDEFRIYNYAVTQDQIKLIMLGGDAGSAARFGD